MYGMWEWQKLEGIANTEKEQTIIWKALINAANLCGTD